MSGSWKKNFWLTLLLRTVVPFVLVVVPLGLTIWMLFEKPLNLGFLRGPGGRTSTMFEHLTITLREWGGPGENELPIAFLGASDVGFMCRAFRNVAYEQELNVWITYLPKYNPETDPGIPKSPNGRSTTFTLERLDVWMNPEFEARMASGLALVGYGYWDARLGVKPDEFERNLAKIVRYMADLGAQVGIMTSTPYGPITGTSQAEVDAYNRRIEEYNIRMHELVQKLSARGHSVFLIDLAAELDRLDARGVDYGYDGMGLHFIRGPVYDEFSDRILERLREEEVFKKSAPAGRNG